jgi:hypothetical protein
MHWPIIQHHLAFVLVDKRQRVLHPVFVIASRIVLPRMGPTRFFPCLGRIHRHHCLHDQIVVFHGLDQIGIPDQAAVGDAYVVGCAPDLVNFFVALILLVYSLLKLQLAGLELSPWQFVLYPLYVLLGVLILYSVMIGLAATSIWLGRNQSLYDFWFYITNFSRYPMEIYDGPWGTPLRQVFTFVIPILVVINVPARLMAKPLVNDQMYLALFAVLATIMSLAASRWIFGRALLSYRSASS